MRHLIASLLLLTLAGCGGSPTDPSSAGESPKVLQGQTVSVVDGVPTPSVTVQIGTQRATSDANGYFELELDPGNHRTTVRGSSVVERDTTISGPTAERARVTLIPAVFDLRAFDEMFRASNARLQRWMTRPGLVVLGTVMSYRNTAGSEYEAGSEQLSDSEVAQMIEHLTEGIGILTGGTYGSFATVEVERPERGTKVNALRHNKIVVGRYNGIVTFANTIGYGQWSEMADGTIVEGAMYLDRDFDRGDPRRRLLRIHELGHALGYQHVTSRTSIMNPAIGPDVTEFDRHGALIAFQRPIGNRAPDVDPGSTPSPLSMSEGGPRRMPPVYCR